MNCQNMLLIIIFIITSLIPHLAKSEFYTAISEMEKLLHTEEEIVKTLEKYLKIEEERLEKVKWFSNQYAKLHSIANKDAETFLSNPVNAYLLVKRLTADWEIANKLMENSESIAVVDNVTSKVNFPSSEDLSGAATALLRLQEIYYLDTATIAKGLIKGATPSEELTAGDCFELGRQAFEIKDYNFTMIWMEEALDRYNKEDVSTADKIKIMEYLAFGYYTNGKFKKAVTIAEELLSEQPYNLDYHKNLAYYRETVKKHGEEVKVQKEEYQMPPLEGWPEEYLHPSIQIAYEKLCREESLKTPSEQSKLHCYYTTNNNSYLLLQPVKVEVLNIKPWLVMYYDIISDKEANIIKTMSGPMLARATVNNGTSGQLEYANYRISKSTWLYDYHHPIIPHLNKRIQDITGIDARISEALHVINYGIAGHYDPHLDFSKEGEKVSFMDEMGNRIATWIFYLSDVPAGGATVFPSLGVIVKPVKGAAAFWYNLFRNGRGDDNTRHAACPVLAGSKWVANKWLHEFGNEFKRPCSLNPLE